MRSSSLILILIASFSSTLFAQDCNNPLLVLFGFVGTGTPQSGSDLPFCSNLQGGQTCCDATVVGSFQNKTNALIERFNNYFAAKDLYLAQLRNSYLERFDDFLINIDDHNAQLQDIIAANATIGNQLQGIMNAATQLSNNARTINNHFIGALDDYQKARTECFNIALQVQASSWCLACDPNYANEGVNPDGTVTFSDGLCEAISAACWPFFNQEAKFNPLIRAREAYWNLSAVSGYLDSFAADNTVVPFNISADPYNPLPTQQPVIVPNKFDAANESVANGQCTDLWAGDEALAQLFTIGNSVPVPAPNATSRLLQNVLAGANGLWAPAYLNTGLNINALRFDPGDFFGVGSFSVIADLINEMNEEEGFLGLTEEELGETAVSTSTVVVKPGKVVVNSNS